jgi:hypothetical protein
MGEWTSLTGTVKFRKNLLTASLAGHGAGAEAQQQLRSRTANNPIAISSADLRRPSESSVISLNSIDASSAGANGAGLDGHVPHMICKPALSPHPKVLALAHHHHHSCPSGPCSPEVPHSTLVRPWRDGRVTAQPSSPHSHAKCHSVTLSHSPSSRCTR